MMTHCSEALLARVDRRLIRAGSLSRQLTLCCLGPEDLGRLIDFRAQVLANLEHSDMYVPEINEAEFLSEHLGKKGLSFGVLSDTRLVSYGMLGFPEANDDDNLGAVLGLDERQRAHVAHLASCMTVNEFRGLGLQQHLAALRMEVARAVGRRYCIAMVSLHNHSSRRNLLASGMTIRWVGKLNGLKRQLMVVDLGSPITFGLRRKTLSVFDFDGQCEMTRLGWWGTSELASVPEPQLEFREVLMDREMSMQAR